MTQRTLHLAPRLSLPLDAVTQTIGILAKRRAGKSYMARRLAEQLLHARQQVVIVDPKGDWWGIRSAADGKGPGFRVTILGGERGDIPLEASAGEVVAKLAVEERADLLLDLSLFRKHEVATFMTAFLENLYRLKAREDYRTAMMLVVDEADAVAPQRPQKGEERMLGAAEDIVRRGGQRGIGCTLVTQRSAVLNKNVLTQCQVLIGLRTIAPQDLDALKEWIDVHGTTEGRKILMESLPSLPVGDAWIWSPGWPTDEGIFERVHVLPIETFDSGATPKPGEKRKEPKAPAEVDLEALRRQMAATLERAKADDPRELRRQIAQLKKELAAKPKPAPAAPRERKAREIPVIKDAQLKRFETLVGRITAEAERHGKMMGMFWGNVNDVAQALLASMQSIVTPAARPAPSRPTLVQRPAPAPRAPAPRRHLEGNGQAAVDGPISSSQKKILDALAWLEMVGIPQASKTQVALLADQSPTSGGYFNNLGRLRSSGLIEYPAPSVVRLTREGNARASVGETPTSNAELHEQLYRRLSSSQAEILRQLIAAYPDPLAKDDLAQKAGQSPTSGGYFNNLGRLRSLGLVDYPVPGSVVATPALFIET